MEKLTIDKLNQIYQDADQVDQAVFAEQRSNILLVLGEHYAKKNSKYWARIRDSKTLSEEQKVRITKNHLQRISKGYINNILTYAPGVMPIPKNEKEMSDIKAAEINHAVWQDICDKHSLHDETYDDAQDFINIGEVCNKVFWDPDSGKFLGWEQEVDEQGQPMFTEDGEPAPSQRPVYEGGLIFERVYGFNLLRSRSAKSMRDNDIWIVRKMANIDELKLKLGNDPEKIKLLDTSSKDTYLVFEGINGGYKKSDGEVLIREFYIKPCYKYPMGYFYISTEAGILWDGELPEGIWPLIYSGFDSAQTTPRHYSMIRQLRPLQVEVNRSASKIAETQVTLGDDKLMYQSGTKLSPGAVLPGIRGVQFSGMKPEILPGRSGDQYVSYMTSCIDEMYQIANLKEDEEQLIKQADPFAMLFMSLRDKKKFSIYAQKFEKFQVEKCKLALKLTKIYAPNEMLIPAIGKNEIVNISEFKNTNELSYEIKLKPMVDDITTMFGKQMVMNTALQYVGAQLGKEDIGRIIRNMPFGNADESFSDLTLDYDTATNLILALDRGEQPEISPYDNHDYVLKRVVNRVRQSDFRVLSPNIQENYKGIIMILEKQKEEQLIKLKQLESQFIPASGAKVKVDYYVEDPATPGKVSRATLPAEAVDWLIKRLAEQGSSQEQLQKQTQGVVSEIAANLSKKYGIPPETQPIPNPQDGNMTGPQTTM